MNTEDSTITCQYCKQQTPSEFNFCSKCYAQIKCVECGTKTYLDVEICLGCGQPLVAKNQSHKSSNIYTRHVKKEGDNYEEDIRFELTDDSVGKIAPFIVGQTMPNEKSLKKPLLTDKSERLQNDVSDYYDVTTVNEGKPNLNEEEDPSPTTNTVKSKSPITEFFKNDNGIIVAIENDFKGKTWSEQQKNFIILFTKAHMEILKTPLPEREIIREAAKKLNILDPNNFSTYFTKISAQYMTELSNGWELNAKGNKELDSLIKLMQDENSPQGFTYAARSNSGATKKARISSDEKSAVDNWVNDDVDLKKLDVRNIRSGRDAALLALWILTVNLKKVKAAPIYLLLYYLNKKFTTISVTQAAVSKSITLSKEADKYFQKNSEGEYFLSPTGQKLVEEWVSGAKTIQNKDSD